MTTQNATYTERYIAAATRALPERNRADLTAELGALVADAIAARTDAGEPAEVAERSVLDNLGDPAKLAAQYADRPLTLIGPAYFLDWWRVLKLLLWTAPPVAVLVQIIVQALAGQNVGEIIGSAAATAVIVIMQVAFWVTLAFGVLERTQPQPKKSLMRWSLDQLPELREPGLGRGDMVASLVFLLLAVGAIAWDYAFGFVFVRGENIPILDPAIWPWPLLAALPLVAAEGALAVVVYRRGRWTPALAAINTVLALAFAVPVIWLIVMGMLVNPAFVDVVTAGAAIAPVATVVASLGVAVVAAWDVSDGWVKARRARQA